MDTLLKLPLNSWLELQEKLLKNWPRTIAGYYTLKKNLQYPKLREAFQVKVYCPFGDMDNGFVITSLRGYQTAIILSPVTDDSSKLKEALSKTELIKWSETDTIREISSQAIAVIRELESVIQPNIGSMIIFYYLSRTTVLFEDMPSPDGTNVTQVKQEDIARVSETWFEEFPVAFYFFSTLAANGFSYGLYSNGKLVAWVFTSEHNVLQHLYCEKEYRMNGYGEYLLKFVVNDQLQQGNDVYCYVDINNKRPQILLKKVGFEAVDNFYYARFGNSVIKTVK